MAQLTERCCDTKFLSKIIRRLHDRGFFFFFFFPSYFTSMCNALGYDRPLSIFYIHMPAWLLPLMPTFLRCIAALSLQLLGFTLLSPNLNYHLAIQLILPFFDFLRSPLQLLLCSSFLHPYD